MSRQDEINRLKQDIERLHQKNKYEFNYIYEDTQSMNPYPRKSPPQNTNTIYSINNNPIIYQKIVNTSYNGSATPNKNLPLSLLLEYQKSIAHTAKASTGFTNYKRPGRNVPTNNYLNSNNTVNKSTELFKAPFKPGIFSYKKRGDFSQEKNRPSSRTKNFSKFNSSMLSSQDIKINFLDEGDSMSIVDSGVKHFNNSSLNLNRYKITTSKTPVPNDQHNMIKINVLPNKSMIQRNLSMPDAVMKQRDSSSNIRSLKQYKINNDNTTELSPIGMSPSIEVRNPKNINNITQIVNSNSASSNIINQPVIYVAKENTSYFKSRPSNERESRRLMIEYVKLIKKQNSSKSISSILSMNNYSSKILQQDQVSQSNKNIAQSSNFFSGNQSPNTFLFSPNPESLPNPLNLNSKPQPQPNISIYSNMTDGTKQYSQFLSDITDDSKEKINLINFLTTPRVMNLLTKQNERQAYIFLLSPNTSSYVYGIESYAFRWIELKEGKSYGNFDMIKMVSCLSVKDSYNQFEITVGGVGEEEERSYLIEASTREMCDNYIKCLNYLSQLIKCKIYHKNVNFSNYMKKSNDFIR